MPDGAADQHHSHHPERGAPDGLRALGRHDTDEQLSLFEDPKMEYYREWDRQYDEERARAEDARLLAYERKADPIKQDSALVFHHPSGEEALAAVKQAVKEHPSYRLVSKKLPDGTSCFEITDDGKLIERHIIGLG